MGWLFGVGAVLATGISEILVVAILGLAFWAIQRGVHRLTAWRTWQCCAMTSGIWAAGIWGVMLAVR